MQLKSIQHEMNISGVILPWINDKSWYQKWIQLVKRFIAYLKELSITNIEIKFIRVDKC